MLGEVCGLRTSEQVTYQIRSDKLSMDNEVDLTAPTGGSSSAEGSCSGTDSDDSGPLERKQKTLKEYFSTPDRPAGGQGDNGSHTSGGSEGRNASMHA